MSVVAIIPLRAGSKGLPGKNMREFAGIPLFMHSVNCARSAGIHDIIIATDIEDILQSTNSSFRTYRRSEQSATDTAPTHNVLIETIQRLDLNDRVIVLLQATAPIRTPNIVRSAIERFKTGSFDLCCSVCEVDNSPLKAGTLLGDIFVPLHSASSLFTARQLLPRLYKMDGGTYVFHGQWLIERGSLETERIGVVVSNPDECVDIDTIDDFERAQYLYKVRQEDGKECL